MSSFKKVENGSGWLIDREIFDLGVILAKLGTTGMLYGLEYDLPPDGAQISRVHDEHGCGEGLLLCGGL